MKVLIRPRVAASKISIVVDLRWASAMNLLQGDHAIAAAELWVCLVAVLCLHEVGRPCTTLDKGRIYDWYSLRTIDVWGDRKSAEW